MRRKAAVNIMIVLDLPFPPSVNGLFATNFKTKRRFSTKQYKAWESAAMLAIVQQNVGKQLGKVKVTYEYGRPDKRRRDVENYAKAVSDILVSANIITDDSEIEEMLLKWADVTGVRVTIEGV